MAKSALMVRHDAALALVARGELDPALALSLVVWPPKGELEDESVPLERQVWDESVKAEARRLHAEGLSCPEIAERLAVSFPTVKSWLWDTAGKKRAYRERKRAQLPGSDGVAVLVTEGRRLRTWRQGPAVAVTIVA